MARHVSLFSLSVLVDVSPGQDVISDVLTRVCAIKVNNLQPQRWSNNPFDTKVGWKVFTEDPSLPARAGVRGRAVAWAPEEQPSRSRSVWLLSASL